MATRKSQPSRPKPLTRPFDLKMELPEGRFESVIQVLASRVTRLAGFPEKPVRELSRALADMVGRACERAPLSLRFTLDKESFRVSMRGGNDAGRPLLESWERMKAHRLMDEARVENGALLLVKTLD